MKRDFEFDGSGFGYLWLCFVLSVGIQRAAALDLQQHLR